MRACSSYLKFYIKENWQGSNRFLYPKAAGIGEPFISWEFAVMCLLRFQRAHILWPNMTLAYSQPYSSTACLLQLVCGWVTNIILPCSRPNLNCVCLGVGAGVDRILHLDPRWTNCKASQPYSSSYDQLILYKLHLETDKFQSQNGSCQVTNLHRAFKINRKI